MSLRCVLAALVTAGVVIACPPPGDANFNRQCRDSLPCPDEITIMPCTCHVNAVFSMTLNCSLINTNADLERVFNNPFPFKDFLELIIDHNPADTNNKLTEIKADTFKYITFKRVTIRGTQLQIIEENVFSYSHETLIQLNLQNNKINDFPFESLGLYTELETLLLDGNELSTLEKFPSNTLETLSVGNNRGLFFTPDVLEEIPNLKNLNMESIDLKQIPSHMFQNLSTLYSINFNNNDLTELEESTLDPIQTSVGRLLLANNKIHSAIVNSLNGLMTDAIIDLTNNKISLMTQNIWQPVMDQILNGMMDLTGNPLICGCDMSWLFMEPTRKYLDIIHVHTTCFDGTQMCFLDVAVFDKHCQ